MGVDEAEREKLGRNGCETHTFANATFESCELLIKNCENTQRTK